MEAPQMSGDEQRGSSRATAVSLPAFTELMGLKTELSSISSSLILSQNKVLAYLQNKSQLMCVGELEDKSTPPTCVCASWTNPDPFCGREQHHFHESIYTVCLKIACLLTYV